MATGLSMKCGAELVRALSRNTTVNMAVACEAKGGYMHKATEALKQANITSALVHTTENFKTCLNVSEVCKEEMAEDIVLKMRLAGQAITQECHEQSGKTGADSADGACNQNSMQAISMLVHEHELGLAMLAAQRRLQSCNRLRPPCDFQLAPMLLMGKQHQKEQEQQHDDCGEVLVKGLSRAADFQGKVVAKHAASLSMANDNSTWMRSKGEASLSLLSLARWAHVSSSPTKGLQVETFDEP